MFLSTAVQRTRRTRRTRPLGPAVRPSHGEPAFIIPVHAFAAAVFHMKVLLSQSDKVLQSASISSIEAWRYFEEKCLAAKAAFSKCFRRLWSTLNQVSGEKGHPTWLAMTLPWLAAPSNAFGRLKREPPVCCDVDTLQGRSTVGQCPEMAPARIQSGWKTVWG